METKNNPFAAFGRDEEGSPLPDPYASGGAAVGRRGDVTGPSAVDQALVRCRVRVDRRSWIGRGAGAAALREYRRVEQAIADAPAFEAAKSNLNAADEGLRAIEEEADLQTVLDGARGARDALNKIVQESTLSAILAEAPHMARPGPLHITWAAYIGEAIALLDRLTSAWSAPPAGLGMRLYALRMTLQSLRIEFHTHTWEKIARWERRTSTREPQRMIRCELLMNLGGSLRLGADGKRIDNFEHRAGEIVEASEEDIWRSSTSTSPFLRVLDTSGTWAAWMARAILIKDPSFRMREPGEGHPIAVAERRAMLTLMHYGCNDPGGALAALLVKSGASATPFKTLAGNLSAEWRRFLEDRKASEQIAIR